MAESDRKTMGSLMKAWRKQADLTQEFVAVAIGEKMVTYQRMERGESPIEPDVMRRVAEICGADARRIWHEGADSIDRRLIPPFVLLINSAAVPPDSKLLARMKLHVAGGKSSARTKGDSSDSGE